MKRTVFALLSIVAFAALGVAGPAVTLTGCGEADELVDCAKICNRYEECVDDEYPVDECIDECEANADEDDAFADKADACESCIDDRSCGESFPCIDECIGIVP